MKIYKYPIQTTDVQSIRVPLEARFLSLQVQNNAPYIWALIDENEVKTINWYLYTYGTGHMVYNSYNTFLGTYQLFDAPLVFHVFGDVS